MGSVKEADKKDFDIKQLFLAELWRTKRACGAPWVSKSTHPRNLVIT